MTNWHVEEQLTAYLANEASEEEKNFIESHLEICAECRREADLLKELNGMLDELPLEDPGTAFTDAVMARLESGGQELPIAPVTGTITPKRKTGFFRGSDFRNMVASVVAAFVLFQGLNGILPDMPKYDSIIVGYTTVAKAKIQIWVTEVTQTLNDRR